MIDSACNFVNPYTSKFAGSSTSERITLHDDDPRHQGVTTHIGPNMYLNPSTANSLTGARGSANKQCGSSSKVQTLLQSQYPPQASSTGSASPSSSLSASVSPSIFSSPTSFSSSSPTQNVDLGSSYTWNSYTRTQFPYAQYAASDYYGNMSMSASTAWFPHQAWASNTYGFGNAFDDIAFQTQLQRRSVRCTCPNCTNEMSGLPPIVGPDERGRKQHICHIPGCERLYGKASHLKTHLRWHTGERPFLCLTCGKRFSRSDELQRHGRTHTNYRPYNCPICSKKFSRSDHLSKHKKTHFKDKKSKKSTSTDEKNSSKKIDSDVASSGDEKSLSSTTGALQHTSTATLKTEPTSNNSNTSSVEVPTGYKPYQPFYQNSALFPQNQQSSDLGAQNQLTNPSTGYYPTINPGESAPPGSYSSFTHVQYDPLQAISQSSSTYPMKSDAYSNYPDLISNGMAAANYPISLHQPWNAHNYQN